jgi:tetratricopeptide (TPR) repeat protein
MSEAGQPTYRLEDLKQRWEKNPSSRLYLQLAEEYRKHGLLEEAVAALGEGLEQRPGDLSARVALGRYSVELGRMDEAAAALELAVERDPTHLVASKLLLEVHLQRGDAARAGERLEIYRLLNDRDPELEHLEYRLHGLREDPSPSQEAAVSVPAPTAAETELEELISGHRQVDDPVNQEPSIDLEATQPSVPLVESTGEQVIEAGAPAASMFASLGSTQGRNGDIFDLGPSTSSPLGFDCFWDQLSTSAGPKATPEVAKVPDVFDLQASGGGLGQALAEGSGSRSIDSEATKDRSVREPVTTDPFPEVAAAAGTSYPPLEARSLAAEAEVPVIEAAAPVVEAVIAAVIETAVDHVVDVEEKGAPAVATDEMLASDETLASNEGASEEVALVKEASEEPWVEESVEDVATVTLGGLYLKQGHLEEAAQIFERVLARDPKNHAAIAGLSLSKKPEKTGLTAMDLLADRSLSGTIPAGVTAKKVMILSNYLKHLKNTREHNHVR